MDEGEWKSKKKKKSQKEKKKQLISSDCSQLSNLLVWEKMKKLEPLGMDLTGIGESRADLERRRGRAETLIFSSSALLLHLGSWSSCSPSSPSSSSTSSSSSPCRRGRKGEHPVQTYSSSISFHNPRSWTSQYVMFHEQCPSRRVWLIRPFLNSIKTWFHRKETVPFFVEHWELLGNCK